MNDTKPRAVAVGGTGKTKKIVIGSDSPVSIQTMWKEGIVPVLTDKQALFSLLDKIEALPYRRTKHNAPCRRYSL